MHQYWLSNHVHLCLSGRPSSRKDQGYQVIVMDLRNDSYSSLDAVAASPLSKLVPGWPAVDAEAASLPISENDELVASLVETNVLTRNRSSGKDATPARMTRATHAILEPRSVFDDWSRPRHPIRLRNFAGFWRAVAVARLKRRFLKLESQVSSFVRRQMPSNYPKQTFETRLKDMDVEQLRAQVANFRWLQPWGYAGEDQCMLDSLVLAEYLYRVSRSPEVPRWVFGVRTDPFHAHCWVQAGSIVLNDTVEHVNEFTPIMVI